MIAESIKKIKQFFNYILKNKMILIIGAIIVTMLLLFAVSKSFNRTTEKISYDSQGKETLEWNTSNDVVYHTAYMILNESDVDTDLSIAGNKIKIINKNADIEITPLNVFDNTVISKNEDGSITVPEEGVKLKIEGIQEGQKYEIEIDSVETLYTYSSTFDYLTIEINAETENEISAKIKEIVKTTEDDEIIEGGSKEEKAIFLYEDEDGIIKIKGNEDLEIYYIVANTHGLTSEELENAEWNKYNKEEGINVTKNGIVYSKTKYKNGEYSKITNIPILNIDKLKPTISVSDIRLDSVNYEAYAFFNLSDQTQTDEYAKSGVFGYALTTDEQIPSTFIELQENIDQTIRIDGIPSNGTYYAWVIDKAGNIENTTFEIDFIPEKTEEVLLVLDSPVSELIGLRYPTLQKLMKALDENNITKDSGEVLVQLVKNIDNETVKIKNKNIVLDLNGYSITSKLLEPTFDIVEGKLNIVDDKLNIRKYIHDQELYEGLNAKFHANNENGKVISNNFVAIQIEENGEFTLGTNESVKAVPNTEAPEIRGELKGILNLRGKFDFYDGHITSKVPIDGTIADKPAIYDLTTTRADEGNNLFEAKLKKLGGIVAVIDRTTYINLNKAIEEANSIHGTPEDKVEIDIVTDITVNQTVTIPSDKNIILDLNGYSLIGTSNYFTIDNRGKLEIIDSTMEGEESTGKVLTTANNPAIYNSPISELTLTSGTVEVVNASTDIGEGAILNKGKFTVNGGKISSTGIEKNPSGIYNEGTLILNDGEILATSSKRGSSKESSSSYGIYNNGDLEVNGGTISSKITPINAYTYPYGIYNTASANVSNANINSYYGVYNEKDATITLNTNTISDGTYGLYNEGTMISINNTITSTTYGIYNNGTLNTQGDNVAIENAPQNTTTYGIYNCELANLILTNTTISASSNGITNNGEATITGANLSGHTNGIQNNATGNATIIGGSITDISYGFYNFGTIDADGTEIRSKQQGIYNKGTIDTRNLTLFANKYGIYNASIASSLLDNITSNSYGIYNTGATSEYNIQNIQLKVTGLSAGNETTPVNIYGIYIMNGNVELETGSILAESEKAYVNQYGIYTEKNGNITIGKDDENVSKEIPSVIAKTAGVYNNGKYSFYDGIIKGDIGISGKVTNIPDGYFVLIEEEESQEKLTLEKAESNANLKIAYVGDDETTLYGDIQDAVNACGAENTITIAQNCTISGNNIIRIGENQKITINLNGKRLKTYSDNNIFTNEGELILEDSIGTGSIEGYSNSVVDNKGKLTANGIKIKSDTYGIYNEQSGEATLSNCEISGNEYAICNEGKAIVENNSNITNGIYNKETGDLEVKNSNIIVENSDKNKFLDKVTNMYTSEIVAYGIYNEKGIAKIDSTNISNSQIETDFKAYGIYNEEGKIDVTDSKIDINIYEKIEGYGIYNNSEQLSTVNGTDITVKDEYRNCTMYGIYNTGKSNLEVKTSTIEAKGTCADSKTKSYSGKSYGIYNEGTLNVEETNINTSNIYNHAYGIRNEASGKITLNESNIEILQEGTVASNSLAYGIYNLGELTSNATDIKVDGTCEADGIYNAKTGKTLIDGGLIQANHTRANSTSNAYGIRNLGNTTINTGDVEATINEKGTAYGIENSAEGTLILGENDELEPSKVSPSIKGMTYGVYNSGTFSFYDGVIEGQEEKSVYGAINSSAAGYNITKYKHEESEDHLVDEGKEITILEKTYVAHLQSNNQDYIYIEEAFSNAQEVDKITLLSNVVTTSTLQVENAKNIVINLNGYKIINAIEGYILENSGTVEIKDEKLTETKGQIISDSYNAIHNKQGGKLILTRVEVSSIYGVSNRYVVYNEGEMILDDANINLFSSKTDTYGIFNDPTGKITINNGSINGEVTEKGKVTENLVLYGIYNNEGEIIIDNTIVNISAENDYTELYGIYNNSGKLQMTNINLNNNVIKRGILYGIYNNSSEKAVLDGGNITIKDQKNYTQMYGIYNTEVSNFEIKNLNIEVYGEEYDTTIIDTTWTYFNYYGIYNEGIINTKNSTAIKVTNLFRGAYGLYNESNGIIIAEETTITTEKKSGATNTSAQTVYNKGNITLDNCNIGAEDINKAYGIYNETAGEVLITNETEITANSTNLSGTYDSYGAYNLGKITIKDSKITSTKNPEKGKGKGYGIYSLESGEIILGENDSQLPSTTLPEIYGNDTGIYSLGDIKFYDGIVKGSTALFGGISDITENYDLIMNRNNDDEEALLGKLEKVAYIGTNTSVLYDKLQDAVDACSAVDKITLVKDIIITTSQMISIPSNKEITIDLNGKHINGYAKNTIIYNEGKLTVLDSTNDGGKIEANADKVIHNAGNNSVDINVKIIAGQYGVYNEKNGTINVNADIDSRKYAIYNEGTGTINVADVNINGDLYGIYNKDTGLIKLNSTNITGKNIGIYNEGQGSIKVNSGKISIEEDSIKPAQRLVYGIYNNIGTISVEETIIEITSNNSTVDAYAIYNAEGKATIKDVNITMTFVEGGVNAYGIYNNSNRETTVNGGTISISDESTNAKMYGIYNTLNGTILVEQNEINISAPYYLYSSGKVYGSTGYGIYNIGESTIKNVTIEATSTGTDAYGIYNEKTAKQIIDGAVITIRHENPDKKNISAYHGYGIYNESTEGITVNNETNIKVYDNYVPYGIYNKLGKILINNVEILSEQTKTSSTYAPYGIYNTGEMELLGGKIDARGDVNGYGIYSAGEITIGQNDERYISANPEISGQAYGIYKEKGTLNFYDGTINGDSFAIYGYVNDFPEGYKVNYSNSMKTAQLELIGEFVNAISSNDQYYETLDVPVMIISGTESKTGIIEINADITDANQQIIIDEGVDITILLQGNKIEFVDLDTAIINNGTLRIKEYKDASITSSSMSMIVNEGGTLIQNNGTLIIGDAEKEDNSSLQLIGNPAISGNDAVSYGATIDGNILLTEQGGSSNIKPLYITRSANDGKIILSTEAEMNKNKVDYSNEDIIINADADIIPVLKVYSIPITHYMVEYYYEDITNEENAEFVIDNTRTEKHEILTNEAVSLEDLETRIQDNLITGYKFKETENCPLIASIDETKNTIKVFYERDVFEYTVKYYYEEITESEEPNFILEETETYTETAKYGTVIEETDVHNKVITGYELDRTTNLPLTVTEVNENNIIQIYYKRSLFEYKVEYYYEKISNEENPEFIIDNTKTDIFENIKYKTDIKSYTDKVITGYVLDEAKTTELPFANKCK